MPEDINNKGHWASITQNGQPLRVFIGPDGLIRQGPKPLHGASLADIPPIPGMRDIELHGHGEVPDDYSDHPSYAIHPDAEYLPRQSPACAVVGVHKAAGERAEKFVENHPLPKHNPGEIVGLGEAQDISRLHVPQI